MSKKGTEMVEAKQSVSIEAVIQNAIDKGVPVETMERLLAMRRELKQEAAKEAFDRAMAKFQADCPTIVKTKEVRANNGQVAYRFAPIESIVAQVKIPIQENGFSYKTDQELQTDGVKVTVRVVHELGHSEETSMAVPFGTKTQIMSQSQVAAAATTFAKRYAFLNAFGILTGDEDNDSPPIKEPQEAMKPYPVQKTTSNPKYGGAEDEADSEVVIDEGEILNRKEIKATQEMQKLEIKKLLITLGHEAKTLGEAKDAVLYLTGMPMKQENMEKIVIKLRGMAAKDPMSKLGEVLKDSKDN